VVRRRGGRLDGHNPAQQLLALGSRPTGTWLIAALSVALSNSCLLDRLRRLPAGRFLDRLFLHRAWARYVRCACWHLRGFVASAEDRIFGDNAYPRAPAGPARRGVISSVVAFSRRAGPLRLGVTEGCFDV